MSRGRPPHRGRGAHPPPCHRLPGLRPWTTDLVVVGRPDATRVPGPRTERRWPPSTTWNCGCGSAPTTSPSPAATAEMHTFPHTECPTIEAAFAGLVGPERGPRLHPRGPDAVRRTPGLHPPRAPGPLARPGRHPGRHLPPGPVRRRGESEDLLAGVAGRAAPGRATPATSGPRTGSPNRSWRPVGDRGRARTPPPPLSTFLEDGGRMRVGPTRGGGARRGCASRVLAAACSNGTSVQPRSRPRRPCSTTGPSTRS